MSCRRDTRGTSSSTAFTKICARRVPFIAQHRNVVEARDDEARAIYDLVCSERWKELAEQAKEWSEP